MEEQPPPHTTSQSNTEDAATAAAKKTMKQPKRSGRGRPRKAVAKKAARPANPRKVRDYPASTFEEALVISQAIQQFAAGQKVRRLTLFDHLQKTPESGPSRQLLSNSSRYGLTKGTHTAEYIELTEDGRKATDPENSPIEQLRARFRLAIDSIAPFKVLYDRFKGNKLPAQTVMRDVLIEQGYPANEVAEGVDTFVLNAKYLGLLKPVAGAERLLPIEHVAEDMEQKGTGRAHVAPVPSQAPMPTQADRSVATTDGWDSVCFYITPIGEPDSETRKHADLFLETIVEPAIEEFGLTVVRADHIAEPGMITRQVIEHVVNSKLVVADLSFHNPNVFYELALRHACRKPIVQLIRAAERIPFDIDQFRTVKIDTSSIYTLVPQIVTYRAEIANQIRRVLADPDAVDNPISVFFPSLRVSIQS
jgi:hypothetical protein